MDRGFPLFHQETLRHFHIRLVKDLPGTEVTEGLWASGHLGDLEKDEIDGALAKDAPSGNRKLLKCLQRRTETVFLAFCEEVKKTNPVTAREMREDFERRKAPAEQEVLGASNDSTYPFSVQETNRPGSFRLAF